MENFSLYAITDFYFLLEFYLSYLRRTKNTQYFMKNMYVQYIKFCSKLIIDVILPFTSLNISVQLSLQLIG